MIDTKTAADSAAIQASMSHGGEHEVVACGRHWHVQRRG